MAVKLALVKRARLCRPERALVVTVVLVLALLTLRQAPLPPSTPPPSLTTTDPSEVPLVDSRTPVKALSSRAWPKVVRPVATLQTAMPISKPLVQLPEDVWGNSERFGAWYCAKDISASTQFTSHESFKRLTGDARSAALALNAAFIKGSMLRGAAAAYAGGLPSHYSPPCVLGTLVVEADFTSWLQITAGWSAPLAHLTLVANTDSKHVMSIVRDITAALASAGHGIVLEHFPENRGVAQGWNAAWNSVAPYSDVDWMLLMNADFQVECSTLRSYLAETHHLQSTRNQNLSNVINATAAEHWDPANDLNGVPAPKGGFDRCRRLTRGLTRVPNPTDDDASPVAVHHLVQWAALVVFRIAIEAIGAFDGNVWPAYSEDIEWCVRIRVHGGFTRTFFTMKPNGHRRSISCSDKPTDCGVVHRSSTVLRKDTRFADMTARWGRGEYLFRKWGFNRREAPKAITPSFCPYLTPFDVPYLSIGEGVEGNIDPNHRKCVEGKLPEANLRYTGAGCNACFFNATSLIAKVADRLDPARREKLQGRLGSRNCAGVPNY